MAPLSGTFISSQARLRLILVSIWERRTLVSRELINSLCTPHELTISIFENGGAKVLENAEGARTTPSVVAFTKGEFAQQSR